MKKYSFRLEQLLRIRRYKERIWEMRLAEITGQCVGLERHIRELGDEKAAYADFSAGGVIYSVEELQCRESFRLRLGLEIAQTQKRMEEKLREREHVNRYYLAASRDRKVLEKLEERKSAEYYYAQRWEEGKILDETASSVKIRAEREERE
jgi:flagellar export protein FliJ